MLIRIINRVWERCATNLAAIGSLKYALALPFLLMAAPAAFAFSVPSYTPSGSSTTITWSCSTTYCLLQQYVSGSWSTETGGSDSQQSATLTLPDGTHSFRIQRCTVTGTQYGSSTSCTNDATKQATVGPAAPGVPSSIASSDGSTSYDGSYNISWGAGSGDIGYYRWRENSGSWQNTGTARATPTLTRNDGTYTYNVQACNSDGCSASKSLTVKVNKDINPTIARSTATSTGSYSLSWTAGKISGKNGEAVWIHESGTSSPILVYGKNSSGTLVTNQNPLTRSKTIDGSWTYYVTSCVNTGYVTYGAAPAYGTGTCKNSSSTTVTVTRPPGIPSSISSSDGGTSYDGSYTVSWGAASGNVSYYQWRENSGTWQNVGTGLITPTLARADGSYTYNVQACNSVGCSGSKTMTVTVNKDVSPTISRSTATSTSGSYSLPWTAGKISGKTGEAVWIYESGTPSPILVYGRNSSGTLIVNNNPLTRSKTADGTWTYYVKSCVNTGYVTGGYAPAPGTGTCKNSSSTTVAVTLPPSVPSSISSSDGGNSYDGSYTVSWGAASGNVSYYQWRENSGTWQNVGTGLITPTLARADGSYTYNVQACNSVGCSGSKTMMVTVNKDINPTIGRSTATSTSGSYSLPWTAGKISGKTSEAVWIYESGTSSPILVYGRNSSGTLVANNNPLTRSKAADGTWTYYVKSCVNTSYVTGGSAPAPGTGTCKDSGSTTVTVELPTVNASFSPSTVDEGGSSTLTWSSTNATSCSASGISGVSGTSGSVTYTAPSVGATPSKTITVTCSGGGATVSKSATVSINDIPAAINASTTTSTTGSYTISWDYAKHAAKIYERVGLGSWNAGSMKDPAGQQSYTKTTEGTYYYKVEDCYYDGPNGSMSCTQTDTAQVTVDLPAPTVNASFDPARISEGQGSTLEWSSANATSCSATGISGVSGTTGNKAYNASSTMSADETVAVTMTCTGNGGTTSKNAQLYIDWVNDKPTISGISDQLVYKNHSTDKLAFTIDDEETTAVWLLQVSGASSNTTLVPNNNITFEGGGDIRTVKVTPAANNSGTTTITLTVIDEHNGSASTAFNVTVSESEAVMYQYDALGRLKTTIDEQGKKTSYDYDNADNRLKKSIE